MQGTHEPYLTELTMYQEMYLERQQYIMIREKHGAVFLGAKQGFEKSDLKPKSKWKSEI